MNSTWVAEAIESDAAGHRLLHDQHVGHAVLHHLVVGFRSHGLVLPNRKAVICCCIL